MIIEAALQTNPTLSCSLRSSQYEIGAGEKVQVYKDGMFREVGQEEKKKKKEKKKGTGGAVVKEAKGEKKTVDGKKTVDDSGNKKRKAAHSIIPADTSNIPKKKVRMDEN